MANDTSDGRVSISYVIDRLDGLVSQDTAALSDISSFVEFRDELVFNLGQNVLERSRTGDRPDFAAVGLDSNFGPQVEYETFKMFSGVFEPVGYWVSCENCSGFGQIEKDDDDG